MILLSKLVSFYQDIAPSAELLRPLLPPNPYLHSLKVDCTRLDDSSLDYLLQPTLQELCLHKCADFSGRLLSQVGQHCKDLRLSLPPKAFVNFFSVETKVWACIITRIKKTHLDVSFSWLLACLLVRFIFIFRFLYLSSLAEKRGRSIDVSDLEVLFGGCTQLEVRLLESVA